MISMAAVLFAVGFVGGFVALRKKRRVTRVAGSIALGIAAASTLLIAILVGGDS